MSRPGDPGPGGSRAATGDPPLVVVVDDEPPIRHALLRVLAFEAVATVEANDAAQALGLLRAHDAAVVLTDQHMPGGDGIGLLRWTARLRPGAARLLFSGHADPQAIGDAEADGTVDRFIAKPWHDDDLRLAVRHGVARWRLRRGDADPSGLDAAPVATVVCDADGRVRLANALARQLFPAVAPKAVVADVLPARFATWLAHALAALARGRAPLAATIAGDHGPLRCEAAAVGGELVIIATPASAILGNPP